MPFIIFCNRKWIRDALILDFASDFNYMILELQDFVLLIKAESLDDPRAFAEYNEETDTHCVMLTMVPRFTLTEVRSELVFIVDR